VPRVVFSPFIDAEVDDCGETIVYFIIIDIVLFVFRIYEVTICLIMLRK